MAIGENNGRDGWMDGWPRLREIRLLVRHLLCRQCDESILAILPDRVHSHGVALEWNELQKAANNGTLYCRLGSPGSLLFTLLLLLLFCSTTKLPEIGRA